MQFRMWLLLNNLCSSRSDQSIPCFELLFVSITTISVVFYIKNHLNTAESYHRKWMECKQRNESFEIEFSLFWMHLTKWCIIRFPSICLRANRQHYSKTILIVLSIFSIKSNQSLLCSETAKVKRMRRWSLNNVVKTIAFRSFIGIANRIDSL